MGRVFANGPEDLGSIPGHIIPKTLKMAHHGVIAIKEAGFWSPSTTVAKFTLGAMGKLPSKLCKNETKPDFTLHIYQNS